MRRKARALSFLLGVAAAAGALVFELAAGRLQARGRGGGGAEAGEDVVGARLAPDLWAAHLANLQAKGKESPEGE